MALDCVSDHHVFVMDRGGKRRLAEIVDLNQVIWSRIRDDISESQIDIVGNYCSRQADLLNSLEPGRHELAIFRGDERVWEGPLNRVSYGTTTVSLFAKDVMYYLYRTIMQQIYSSAYPNVETCVGRAYRIASTELTRRDVEEAAVGLDSINVLPFIQAHHFINEAQTTRVTNAWQATVFEQIDDLAAKSGMDYSTVGRAIHLFDNSRALGQTPVVTEADFLGDVNVSVYGAELATLCAVTNGDGTVGYAGTADPYYGLWEMLATAYDESTANGAPPPTQPELNSQALRNLSGRNPTPVVVRIPDNSQLNPTGVLTMADLVPGVRVPLRATLAARTVSQYQKLNKVTVKETSSGEAINVTFVPASEPDEDDEEV